MTKTAKDTKVSIKGVVRDAIREDRRLRKERGKKKTVDSIQNFAAGLGIGTDNITSRTTYGFNPITRIRTELEWIHRGSWLGGIAVDLVADDMTRAGASILGEMKPDDIRKIEEAAVSFGLWEGVHETVQWSRLYGGALGVHLIDGQNPATPLKIDRVGKNQYKGMVVFDRWMLEPSLSDLVTEYGPFLGLPKYYRVTANAPAMSGERVHYSRCIRMDGVRLPYWQRVMENLWGISVLERIYDRMIAFDSATQGAAQLVYKSYIRTYKLKDLSEAIAAGGPAERNILKYVNFMRQMQGIEGITLLDLEDEFEAHSHTAFSGLGEALDKFGEQLSGALQIPLVRLFGQSPAGLNSTGESDLRTYYDNINNQQNRSLLQGVTTGYRLIGQSLGIKIPDGFGIKFRSLWQLTDVQKSEVADKIAESVTKVQSAGLISDQCAMKELKQSSDTTGIFSNITPEDIEKANDIPVPAIEQLMPPGGEGEGGEGGGIPGAPKNKKAPEERESTEDELPTITKKQAKYSDVGTVAEHCGNCKHFMPETRCNLVEGEIKADGWCQLFVLRTSIG